MLNLPFHSTSPPFSAHLSSFLCGAVIALLGIRVSHRAVVIVMKHKQESKPLPSVSQHEAPLVSLRHRVSQLDTDG